MFERIIRFSVEHKFIVFLLLSAVIGVGIYSMQQIPLDAVPDITNNQVQVVTVSPSLAPQEVEQLITFPIEMTLANIPDVTEIRSISRYGLSVITVVFHDKVPILDARQFVREQLNLAEEEIPTEFGSPELMPITTGLGEIYQYTVEVDSQYVEYYDAMELRTIQDWIIKRQLSGIPGIIEVSSFGGYLKQYEIAINPISLRQFRLTIQDVYEALARNNQNSGGSYIEKTTNAFYIRTEGRINTLEDIEGIVISKNEGAPIFIKNVAEVQWGSPKRYGAMTKNGKGEAVGGITLMLKGANSSKTVLNVKERIDQIQESLPPGIRIESYLDRSKLITKTINTVRNNLVEGGLIVIFILILLLGHWRAGLVVASIIPLSMLFAFIMMNITGVSANLMSLGAIDFGIVVDGAVIIVENILFTLHSTKLGQKLNQSEMDDMIISSSSRIYKSAAFGVLIILVVFLPVISLSGIEGKTFKPMALTVSYAILGAMILSMTYVPVISSLLLSKKISEKKSLSDRVMSAIRWAYLPTLKFAFRTPYLVIGMAIGLFISAYVMFNRMGAEFIPTLEEGDLAMQMTIQPGSSLQESIITTTKAERLLMENFPEVKQVVSKIGTAEVPTDPMAIEDADIMIIMDRKSNWVSANTREEMVSKMKSKLELIVGASFEFTQPIQLRFNELMTGAKTDIAIKIFGEDTEELAVLGNKVASIVEKIPGAGDVRVEQTEGLPQLVIRMDKAQLARYGLNVETVNQAIRTSYAGEKAGTVFEGERRFDLVLRLQPEFREDLDLSAIHVITEDDLIIPLNQIATNQLIEGPMQISREDAKRRIVVGVNVRNRDVASLVADIEDILSREFELPAGYFITYGGQFENLQAAQKRLSVALPIALFLIFVLLYSAFGSFKYSALIFLAVPLSAIGGVYALWIRDMPFSISAGIGFIALFGVAVLNGIVLISHLNDLKHNWREDLKSMVILGSLSRLRPVLMTASVAAFGFLPMALSTSAGAEVQKPLATVVIGGLISSTFLTLIVLPVIYIIINQKSAFGPFAKKAIMFFFLICSIEMVQGQNILSLQKATELAENNNPSLVVNRKKLDQRQLGIRQSYDPGSMELEYQRGNINAAFDDFYWQVTQPLGNPVQFSTIRQYRSRSYEYERNRLLILSRDIKYQTQISWIQWFTLYRQSQILQSVFPLLGRIEGNINRAVEAGEMDYLTQQHFIELSRQLTNLSTRIKLQQNQHWHSLQQLCQLDTQYIPPNQLPVIVHVEDPQLHPVFLEKTESRINSELFWLKSRKADLFPTFSAGYFNQQIEGTSGLDGWKVGVGIPILFQSKSKEIQKAKIELEKVEAENQFELKKHEQQLQNLKQIKRELGPTISPSDGEDFESDFGKLSLALESGNVNYFQLIEILKKSVENHIQSAELKSIYYQIQFQIEFLTR